jgi:hypothetical protein
LVTDGLAAGAEAMEVSEQAALDAAGGSLSAGVPGVAGSFVPAAAADGAATGLAGVAENVAAVASTAADNAVANGIIQAGERAGVEGVVNAAPLATSAAEGAGTSVIGHYPDYVDMAKDLKVNYFSVPTEQWNAMSEAERWITNQKFLDEAAARGSTFRLATSLSEMKKGSYFAREVQYLDGLGYTISKDGTTLIPPSKP